MQHAARAIVDGYAGLWLLVVVGLALVVFARVRQRRPIVEAPPASRIAIIVAVACAAGFAALAFAIHAGERIPGWDDAVHRGLGERLEPGVLAFALAVTRLGDTVFVMPFAFAVACVLAWRRAGLLLGAWLFVTLANGFAIRAFKHAFTRERPIHEHGWLVETGWSFPSGHAAGALAVYGLLAWMLARHASPWTAWIVAVTGGVLVLAIGTSRVVLQVHHPSDIVGGFLLAGTWLGLGVAALERLGAVGTLRRSAPTG